MERTAPVQGAVRNEADSERTAPPFHAQNAVRNEADSHRTGVHGHLSEVPAAYKRGQGDSGPDHDDLTARLDIAEATNIVLTEALYAALEGTINTHTLRDLTEETP